MSGAIADPDGAAQAVLEGHAGGEAHPDASLGSYVVSLLQEDLRQNHATAFDAVDPDLRDSLLELLQDQCGIEEATALQALGEIHGIVRDSEPLWRPEPQFQETALSPQQAQILIPDGLIGELAGAREYNSVQPGLYRYLEREVVEPYGLSAMRASLALAAAAPPPALDQQDFPPLGAAPPKSKAKARRRSQSTSPVPDAGPPGRSREPSLDETASTSHSSASPDPPPGPQHAPPPSADDLAARAELLVALNVNVPLSWEAAMAAASAAAGDAAGAQFLVDAALAAPPVCRHHLRGGCYRADCAYSHAAAVCRFWLQGGCHYSAADCPFRHAFDAAVLEAERVRLEQEEAAARQQQLEGNRHVEGDYGHDGMQQQKQQQQHYPRHGSAVPFSQMAAMGYSARASFVDDAPPPAARQPRPLPTVPIPPDLWNPHENRDARLFHIADPLERFAEVSRTVSRPDVIDLHFQSTATFPAVLAAELDARLAALEAVWVVTGTGHHVGSRTHQRGGGALERAVTEWLLAQGYRFARGRDRNGQGGALRVTR